jgi:hypothetical protein
MVVGGINAMSAEQQFEAMRERIQSRLGEVGATAIDCERALQAGIETARRDDRFFHIAGELGVLLEQLRALDIERRISGLERQLAAVTTTRGP